MFEAVGALEPRIEHSVSEKEIRIIAAPQRPPDSEARVPPNPVHNACIVSATVLPEPRYEAVSVPVGAPDATKPMDRHWPYFEPIRSRRHQGQHFNTNSAPLHRSRDLTRCLDAAAQLR